MNSKTLEKGGRKRLGKFPVWPAGGDICSLGEAVLWLQALGTGAPVSETGQGKDKMAPLQLLCTLGTPTPCKFTAGQRGTRLQLSSRICYSCTSQGHDSLAPPGLLRGEERTVLPWKSKPREDRKTRRPSGRGLAGGSCKEPGSPGMACQGLHPTWEPSRDPSSPGSEVPCAVSLAGWISSWISSSCMGSGGLHGSKGSVSGLPPGRRRNWPLSAVCLGRGHC